jgi:hypothetical protein
MMLRRENPVTKKKDVPIQDADLAKVERALRRAAKRAREIARQTGTPLVIYEKGKIVHKMIMDTDGGGQDNPAG